MHEDTSVHSGVMEAIRTGKVRMRPRWHFLLLSALTIVGVALVFLTLLYVTSLAVFFLRDSGAWYAPSFGARGWVNLARSLPWLLILFIAAFFLILEILVRRYAFVYKKPLVLSLGAIILLIFLGGIVIAPLHHNMVLLVRRGQAPPPFNMLYGVPLRSPRLPDMYHGQIIAENAGGFVLLDEDGAGTTTVVITPATRLPYGSDFTLGERVIVVGDTVATGTVRAFGVREIDEYAPQ